MILTSRLSKCPIINPSLSTERPAYRITSRVHPRAMTAAANSALGPLQQMSVSTPCTQCENPSLEELLFAVGCATYCLQCGYRELVKTDSDYVSASATGK